MQVVPVKWLIATVYADRKSNKGSKGRKEWFKVWEWTCSFVQTWTHRMEGCWCYCYITNQRNCWAAVCAVCHDPSARIWICWCWGMFLQFLDEHLHCGFLVIWLSICQLLWFDCLFVLCLKVLIWLGDNPPFLGHSMCRADYLVLYSRTFIANCLRSTVLEKRRTNFEYLMVTSEENAGEISENCWSCSTHNVSVQWWQVERIVDFLMIREDAVYLSSSCTPPFVVRLSALLALLSGFPRCNND